ncbi:MAG: aminodeoxychorismate synthase component I [Acidobacteriota bacterium]
MRELDITADDLVSRLIDLPADETVCILDSGGTEHPGSHLLIAGIRPNEVREVSFEDPSASLELFDDKLSAGQHAAIFTLSYDFGTKLHSIGALRDASEPDLFMALFDCLVVHDYSANRTFLTGNSDRFAVIEQLIKNAAGIVPVPENTAAKASSNFTRAEYLAAVENVKVRIRAGDTYQTNITQQIRFSLSPGETPGTIFSALRRQHPAPFGSYIRRLDSTVVSASPERFFKVTDMSITASPIKGTRRRGETSAEDSDLRNELLASDKDRAENTMIVDLTRNDLGRICEFGSVRVERLCEIEEHPTLFHLVSTVTGKLRAGLKYSSIIRALFPCGSITGAPKLSTMKIIAQLEPSPRGLSMGSIGVSIPSGFPGLAPTFEMNVAIRTIVIRGGEAVFNVGGGIVIDSDPQSEYEESLLKAQALLAAAGVKLVGN